MKKGSVAKKFGLVVRRRRRAAEMSQEALAGEASVHPTYVSLLERGLRNPSLETVAKLARALECSAWELVREAEEGKG